MYIFMLCVRPLIDVSCTRDTLSLTELWKVCKGHCTAVLYWFWFSPPNTDNSQQPAEPEPVSVGLTVQCTISSTPNIRRYWYLPLAQSTNIRTHTPKTKPLEKDFPGTPEKQIPKTRLVGWSSLSLCKTVFKQYTTINGVGFRWIGRSGEQPNTQI